MIQSYRIYNRTSKFQANLEKRCMETIPCNEWVVEINGLQGVFKTENEAKIALNDMLNTSFIL